MPTIQDSRILIKSSTVTGVVPTIPSSNDHTDGTWLITDLYKGELFVNQADSKVFYRSASGIVEVGSGASLLDYIRRDGTSLETTGNINIGSFSGFEWGATNNAKIEGSGDSGLEFLRSRVVSGLNSTEDYMNPTSTYSQADRKVGSSIVESGYCYITPSAVVIGRDFDSTEFSNIEASQKGIGLRANNTGPSAGYVYLKTSGVGASVEYTQELQAKNGTVALLSDITGSILSNPISIQYWKDANNVVWKVTMGTDGIFQSQSI